MNVEVITIGDELLIGQVIDTNSAWMGRELNKIGWEILRITSVRDRIPEIIEAFDQAFDRVDVVLVTGGLGPTKDDITKQALCLYFDSKLVYNESVMKNIEQIFWSRSVQMNQSTRSQAMVPDKCEVIQNTMGTAPVMWFEKNGKILVSMPGVPYEMEEVMGKTIIPRLASRFSDGMFILHYTAMVRNFTESALSEYLESFESGMPGEIRLAYLPSPGVIRLRLTARGLNEIRLSGILEEQKEKLKDLLKDNIYSEEDIPLPETIGKMLLERHLTMAIAESCTGGNIAAMITSVSGSSAYFSGGIVAYSNEVKKNVLQVNSGDLENFGAVSEAVVKQMCTGVSRLLKTDCAVATSGVAGPTGGTPDKPVGTVWIAVSCRDKVEAKQFTFGKNRKINVLRASQAALLMMLEMLSKEK